MATFFRRHRSLAGLIVGCLWFAACSPNGCTTGGTDGGNAQCALDRDCPADSNCVDGACVVRDTCATDADCALEEKCDALSRGCVLRTGFGHECGPQNENAVCPVGKFCSLGACKDTATATQCSRSFECNIGQVCDRTSFYCIPQAPCTYAAADGGYPELACGPGETCDVTSGNCITAGAPECDFTQPVTGCASDEICTGAGRCVQCQGNADCGPGLRCNTRAGLCESTNTCRSNSECPAPLVCDRATAVCAVPLPPCTSDFQCQLGQFCDRQLGTCQPTEGKCEDDRFEDSDTPVAARVVDLSMGTATVDDLQLCPNDPDVFFVALAAGDGLTVKMVGATASSHAELSAIDSDGLTTLRFVEAPPRGTGSVSFVAQRDAQYYIRTISLTGQSAYRLEFTRTFVGACMADAYEPESDSPFTARSLSSVINGGLSLCPGDVDWYRISSPTPGSSVAVTLDGPDGEDFDLELTDQFGVEVKAASQGRGADEFIRYQFGSAEDALIAVKPFGSSTGNYVLTVETFPAFMCVADMYDLAVNGMGDGPLDDGGVDTDAGDMDAAVDDAGEVDAAVDDAGELDAAVEMDAGEVDAAVDMDAGEMDAGEMDAGEMDAGEVPDAAMPVDAAVVMDASVVDAAVVMDASMPRDASVPADAGSRDAGPPVVGNNTRASATQVSIGGLSADLSVCLGDEDWFAVEARSHQRVVVTATWPPGEAGVQVEAYAGTTLLGRATGLSVAVLSVPGNDTGIVYVRVTSPGAASPYHLDIDVERRVDCEPDNAEPNNTPMFATPTPGEGIFTLCGTDVDLFRLDVTAGKRVKATVEFSTSDGDIDLGILLPDGVTFLDVSDGVTGSESVDVIIPADPPDGGNRAYYLTVFSGRSDTKARYHLTTQVLAP